MNKSPVLDFLYILDEKMSITNDISLDFSQEVKNSMPKTNKFSEHFEIFQSFTPVKPAIVWININKKDICYFSMDHQFLKNLGMRNFSNGDFAVVSYTISRLDISSEVLEISAKLTNGSFV